MILLKKKNENKYLNFTLTENNKEVLEKYIELWDGIKNLIEKQIKIQVNMEKIT